MSDDAFHLTSHDVRAQEFQRVLRGYDPAQVEEFKQRLSEEIDRLVRDRVQLDERLKNLGEQLKGFRDRERAMNDALVHAQQLRAETQATADREADLILREARAEGEKLRLEARMEAQRILEQGRAEEQRLAQSNDLARRQYQAFLTSYRQLLERQLHELQALAAAEVPAAEPAPVRRPA